MPSNCGMGHKVAEVASCRGTLCIDAIAARLKTLEIFQFNLLNYKHTYSELYLLFIVKHLYFLLHIASYTFCMYWETMQHEYFYQVTYSYPYPVPYMSFMGTHPIPKIWKSRRFPSPYPNPNLYPQPSLCNLQEMDRFKFFRTTTCSKEHRL